MVVIQGKSIQTRQLLKENIVMAAEIHAPSKHSHINTLLCAPDFKAIKILEDLLCFEKLKFIYYD